MDLLGGVRGAPSAWTKEIETHHKALRRVVVRWANASGDFEHAATVFLEPVESTLEGDIRFKLTLEDGPTLVPLEYQVTPRMIVEHCWAAVCSEGMRIAERDKLKRMRGELEGYDGSGESLWDSEETRKRLNLDDPASPIAEDDDPTKDPQEKKRLGELAYERREHRETKRELRASLQREREITREASDMLLLVSDTLKRVNHMEVDFAKYVGQRIRDDIEESRADARLDAVTEAMIGLLQSKGGILLEGLAMAARQYGQQRDPLEVPEPPAEFEGWLLEVYADSYTDYAGEKVKLRTLIPGSPEYRQAWFDHLAMLNNSVEGHALTTDLAKKIKLWATAAAQCLGLDPHLFSRLAFCEGDPEADLRATTDDPDTPRQPGGSPPQAKGAES